MTWILFHYIELDALDVIHNMNLLLLSQTIKKGLCIYAFEFKRTVQFSLYGVYQYSQ